MADSFRNQTSQGAAPPPPPPPPPPPAPPLPPQRYANRATSALARFAQPFFYGSRPPSPQPSLPQEPTAAPAPSRPSISRVSSPPTIAHKTGIPIAALDISPQRTHAVVAGREILKTIRVTDDQCVEDFDIRAAIVNYSSSQHVPTGALAAKHKDQLAAKDVKWSHAEYDRVIATAAANGRIVVYDLARPGLELGRFQEHSRQVHRLAFNPHRAAWLLSGSQDATIRMWDLRMLSGDRGVMNFGSKHRFNGHSEAVRDIRWSPADGVEFATATDSGAIQRWDVRKESAPLLKINAHEKPCAAIDWHPDGKHVVSGGVDRQVKVWDFSSSDRRQKPAFQFRAPQMVSNVRWRPPSWSDEAQDRGDWQSTQLATSYEQDDPRIHLWDLRRPYIPYREFDYYGRLAVDMLWRSSNMMWTVTGEGAFTQTDFNSAPKVIHRRKPCSIAWSPDGNILVFARERQKSKKRSINFGPAEFLGPTPARGSTSGEKSLISQSLTDESLDDSNLISSLRKRPGKGTYMRGSKSLSATPPATDDCAHVVSLEKAVANSGSFEPRQGGIIGHVAGATFDSEVFKYLAQHYEPMTSLQARISSSSVQDFMASFDENAIQAERVSLHRLAQTWRIIGYVVGLEISTSVAEQATQPERHVQQKGPSDPGKIMSPKERLPNKGRSLLFKGVVESQGQKQPESEASNVTTPLAQAIRSSPTDTIESADPQASLPANGLSGKRRMPPSVPAPSNSISSDSGMQEREVTPQELRVGGARSAPRAIAGRPNWRFGDDAEYREGPGLSEEDYDQKEEEKRAALRDFKAFPKKILTLDPLNQDSTKVPIPPTYARHDSAESFPMFSASTDSSHRAKSLAEADSPRTRPEPSRLDSNTWSGTADSLLEDIPELDIGSPPDFYRKRGDQPPTEENSFSEDLSSANNVHLERPSRPLPFLAETLDPKKQSDEDTAQNAMHTSRPEDNASAEQNIFSNTTTKDIVLPIPPPTEESKPWSAHTVIREAIRHYASNSTVDIVSAAHLLHKMHVLFSSCEDILPYEERELIFKTYNELLLRHGMYVEAAELRLLCAPSYPSVYDYAQKDTFINVFCFECNKPYENPTRDNKRCHRCGQRQLPCTVCMSQDPPAEWTAAFAPASHTATLDNNTSSSSPCSSPTDAGPKSNTPTDPLTRDSVHFPDVPSAITHESDTASPPHSTTQRPHGSALWSWCQGCGHGAHTACLTIWLNDVSLSEGGCATPGCLHDCGPGPRRAQNRAARQEANKRARDSFPGRKTGMAFAKRDSWPAGESKAVERVRGMLGVAASASAGAASGNSNNANSSTSSGAVVSPKKVRLVTPGEQDT